jgi:2-methylcitrate dehydratase PrpD
MFMFPPVGCDGMTEHGSTDALASYCATAASEPLPPDVRDRLKQHLLDFVGLTLGASEHAASSPSLFDAVETLAGGYEGGAATVLPTGERRAAEHAALLNGALAHSLDFDDTHRESSLHPGAVVVPAALAVAEREGVGTDQLLRAIDAGYDAACAVGRAVNPDAHYDRGFHITATCGTFGATAAAGVVSGLDTEEFANTFGVNGSQAAGSLQFLSNGAWNKRLHPGLAARRGVLAVALAENGFDGAAEPLEGEHGFFHGYTSEPNVSAFDRLGDHAVRETSLKPYPCCRYMHAALDGLCDLASEVDPAEVESVTVDLPQAGVTLTGDPIEAKRRPTNLVDCQFSMPFGAALALTEGEAGLDAFLDAQSRLGNARLRHLMDATEVVTTDAVQSVFPEQWAARVVVRTADGEHERFVEGATGDPESPLGWEGVTEKFVELATGAGATRETAAAVVDAVQGLDEGSVEDLIAATEKVTMDGQPAR